MTKGSLLFSASSGSSGPGAFPLCDQGVAIAWVKMPSSWAGSVLQALQNNCQCSHLNGLDNLESASSLERGRGRLHCNFPSEETKGFLRKSPPQSEMVQFYSTDISIIKQNWLIYYYILDLKKHFVAFFFSHGFPALVTTDKAWVKNHMSNRSARSSQGVPLKILGYPTSAPTLVWGLQAFQVVPSHRYSLWVPSSKWNSPFNATEQFFGNEGSWPCRDKR